MDLHHAPIVQFAISGTGGRRNRLPSGRTSFGSPLDLLLGRMLNETILEKKAGIFSDCRPLASLFFWSFSKESWLP